MHLNDKHVPSSYGEGLIIVNDEEILEKINEKEYCMKWKDIKKVIKKENIILLLPDIYKHKNKNICFLFYKESFNNKKDFDKLNNYIDKILTTEK
jgi:hypothetical protein